MDGAGPCPAESFAGGGGNPPGVPANGRRDSDLRDRARAATSPTTGPGQLVGYPIFLLRDDERDLHVYLRNLEEALIRALARFDLAGERKSGWTGVWTAGGTRKLASIGVAVKRWVTMHGFALNVSTDLARFAAINPCGLDAAVMGSMSGELGRPDRARRGQGRGPRHLRRGVRPQIN